MISQQITTSKYRTTIQIPAQKLQSRQKFIQIPHQSNHSHQPKSNNQTNQLTQTFIIPSNSTQCNAKFQNYKKQQQYQMKLMIEELELAYNDDMKKYEIQIKELKHQNQIIKLKLEKDLETKDKQIQQYQITFREVAQREKEINKVLLDFEAKVKIKNDKVQELEDKICLLNCQIQALKIESKDKSVLLSTKLVDYHSAQEQKYLKQIQSLTDNYKDKIKSLEKDNCQLSTQVNLAHSQNQSLTKETQSLLIRVENSESQSKNLSSKIYIQLTQIEQKNLSISQLEKCILTYKDLHHKQNKQIQDLLAELTKQRQYIQSSFHNKNIHQQQHFSQIQMIKTQNEIIYADKLIEMENKLIEMENKLIEMENKLLEKETVYLLKLKQIDQLRQDIKLYQNEINILKRSQQKSNEEIMSLKITNQKIYQQLANKLIQYNDLLNRPPEQKVYEVKIQKTIQKKQYILELQNKLRGCELTIEQLKSTILTYNEQIRGKLLSEQELINKNTQLQKQIQQLKLYIQKRQSSIAWVVEREIVKDVEICQSLQSAEKSKAYKVYVKSEKSPLNQEAKYNGDTLIQKFNQINLSIGTNFGDILEQKVTENFKHSQEIYKKQKYQPLSVHY